MSRPFCRRCMIEELEEDEYIRSLKEYIAAYPKDKRVEEEEYSRRLGICREREKLLGGMCRLCGCYVQIRALKPLSRCPHSPDRWKKKDR